MCDLATVGVHTIRISGRSNAFSIDRIHIFNRGCADGDSILDTTVSPVGGTGTLPTPDPNSVPVTGANPPNSQHGGGGGGTGEYTYHADFGVGCCRTHSGIRTNELYIHHSSVTDFGSCVSLCSAQPACNGFELTQHEGCELHTSDITHVSPDSSCQCMIRHGDTPPAGGGNSPPPPPPPPANGGAGVMVGSGSTAVESDCVAAAEIESAPPTGCGGIDGEPHLP